MARVSVIVESQWLACAERHAAVEDQRLACHHGCRIGREINESIRDLDRLNGSSERDLPRDLRKDISRDQSVYRVG
jgi:hypothetical protein